MSAPSEPPKPPDDQGQDKKPEPERQPPKPASGQPDGLAEIPPQVVGPRIDKGMGLRGIGISEQFAMMSQMADPIAAKLTDSHIASLIQNEETNAKRQFTMGIIQIVALLVMAILVLAFVVLFCWLFATGSPQLVEKVLIGVMAFAGGVGAGIGAPRVWAKIRGE